MAKSNVPIPNPAPAWNSPLSEYVELWHGTTVLYKNDIETHGIQLARCAVDTDFGRGFYTTTLERQAKSWAWERFFEWQARNPTKTGNQPVVLKFRVRRYSAGGIEGLDRLRSLHFVVGDHDNDEFWSLVQHCRQSIPGDKAKGIAEVENDHNCGTSGWYQMVSGPAAAFWRQRVAMNGADQVSFHQGGTHILQNLIDLGRNKKAGRQGDPNFYRWEIVT
jgi:Protein of unknown function (DUF3990)